MFKQTVAAQGLFKTATAQAGINCGNPAACCWLPWAANATVRMRAKEIAGRESKAMESKQEYAGGGGVIHLNGKDKKNVERCVSYFSHMWNVKTRKEKGGGGEAEEELEKKKRETTKEMSPPSIDCLTPDGFF